MVDNSQELPNETKHEPWLLIRGSCADVPPLNPRVSPKKLEAGLRTISAGIPSTLLLRIEAIRFPSFGLLLQTLNFLCFRVRGFGSLPRGSYPTPVLGYLVLWLGSVLLKSRRPKKGVGYEPLGRIQAPP